MNTHFIGIGGIGLSALAKFLHNQGDNISGSDMKENEIIEELVEKYNANIKTPFNYEALQQADRVIYSAAIKPTNEEYKKAKELAIKLISRKEALKSILSKKEVYAVAGAHGKSTTSAILSSILPQTNSIIGAVSKEFKSNVRICANDKVVFEADESDGSFLNSNPYLAIVTNVETEHMEYYQYDENKFYNAYKNFLSLAKIRVINAEDTFLSGLNEIEAVRLYPSKDIKNIKFILKNGTPCTKFELLNYGVFEVFGFGEHMALDASLAILASLELGANIEEVRENILNFKGIKKRFDIIEDKEDCVIIDDYGHHPTEIKATMKSLQTYKKLRAFSKINIIWQPHKYTRTKDNLKEYVKCFQGVYNLVILPIYSAGEEKIDIDIEEAFKNYKVIMADTIKKKNGVVEIYKGKKLIKKYSQGLITGFGAGDITEQIRGK